MNGPCAFDRVPSISEGQVTVLAIMGDFPGNLCGAFEVGREKKGRVTAGLPGIGKDPEKGIRGPIISFPVNGETSPSYI